MRAIEIVPRNDLFLWANTAVYSMQQYTIMTTTIDPTEEVSSVRSKEHIYCVHTENRTKYSIILREFTFQKLEHG